MQDDELKSSTVIRAAQRPATMMWVPLDIFIIEALVLLFAIRFLGLWALALIPLHAIPVLLTQNDAFWPKTIMVNFWHYVIVGNRNLRGKGVTFNSKHLHTRAKPDDYPK